MAKKRKPEWERKRCGCVKTTLSLGRVAVRCERHRGKPSKRGRLVCYWNDGMVRQESPA